MASIPYGNDPAKIERYRAFWSRADVRRPLVGFSLVGWFPLDEFAAAKSWGTARYLTPEMVDPAAFLPDHLRMLREGEIVDDDVIRGACPAQVAVPWIPGMMGAKMRILPQNVLGEEQHLPVGPRLGRAPGPRRSVVSQVHGVRRRAGRCLRRRLPGEPLAPKSGPPICTPCCAATPKASWIWPTNPKSPPSCCGCWPASSAM